ncbi:discoidin domain-containing protein, partial [Bacteroides sp. OttesenSCG-928-E20]|nr:discoidin domain-containing protein [Bacteroides sp. OttesenSCG-928-E20]
PRTNDKVKSLQKLVDIYYTSVGRNSNLLLNVPPDRRGRIHPNDSARLMEFKRAIDQSFAVNLIVGATLKAANTRGNATGYAAQNLIDGNYDSYWAADDGVTQTYIEIDLGERKTFNRLLLQEYIPLGQRVAKFAVECWNEEASQWETIQEATTIGYKRILCFPEVTAQKLKLTIEEALACPVLNNVELYLAPDFDGEAFVQEAGAVRRVDNMEPQVIDMKQEKNIKGFYFIPSPDNTANNLARYNLYISKDKKGWEKVVENGVFNNMRNNPIRQEVLFGKVVNGRYLKLEPLETTTGATGYCIKGLGEME